MIEFNKLLAAAKVRLPGAVDDVMRSELFEVFVDFFKNTGAWTEDIKVSMTNTLQSAPLVPTAGRVERLEWVKDKDAFVRNALLGDNNELLLPHPVRGKVEYTARVVLNVSDPVNSQTLPIIPVYLIERYYMAFMNGLLARMMSQPTKPYSNMQLAMYHENKFKGETSRARNAVAASRTENVQPWRFPSFM